MNSSISKITYLSWSALFGGAVAGVGLNFLFNLLALTLGLACFTVTASGETLFSFWGLFGFILLSLCAMFGTGWIAGALSPKIFKNNCWGLVLGFLSWCILLIFTVILITNMIQYTSFHTNFTSNLVEVKIKSNAPMLTGTVAHNINKSPLSFNIETNKKIITLNAFLTFLLFLLGAISSSIGGYIGYKLFPDLRE
ncbi:hypothetical protein [Legionella saoudiensis]|uniref:hypothetical protein n=1 Tax=Legionella saoudiensis TaxID=1750561 RepID=UPI000731268A|nr:hypothetical protein [Legionella saoudiensis]